MSVRTVQLGSQRKDFHEHMSIFRKKKKNLSRKIQASKKSDKNKGYIALRRTYTSWFLAQFFLDWEMFHAKVVDKIKAHILFIYTVYILLTVNLNIFIS